MSAPNPTPVSQPQPVYSHYQKLPEDGLHVVPPPRNRDPFDDVIVRGGESRDQHNDYWEWRYNNPERADCMRQTFMLRLMISIVVLILTVVVVGIVVSRRDG
jgi:hypothetical protein